ncbi:hypothetical protein CEXT_77571 [Caerostris extrusa]|uniref:Uncharacterized protein n=1 Tax=Caerostris extrusa TaxID=172846 RepID=A0AAV4R750_CAEEX|nr:hypothetical protein CEXT_77571 [Caerostris extrusa]
MSDDNPPKPTIAKAPFNAPNPRLILGYSEILIAVQVPYTLAQKSNFFDSFNMFRRNPDVGISNANSTDKISKAAGFG